jgi:hypothetical protein
LTLEVKVGDAKILAVLEVLVPRILFDELAVKIIQTKLVVHCADEDVLAVG